MLVSGFIVFIILLLLMFLISPILLKIFPSKIAEWGVKKLKSKESGEMVLKFTNHKYAEKFKKANGLE